MDDRQRRALDLAHRILERELHALLRPERADAILERALEAALNDAPEDPAKRLRALVGARLLDETADLLGRVAACIRSDETPTLAIPLELPVDLAAEAEARRRRTPENPSVRLVAS